MSNVAACLLPDSTDTAPGASFVQVQNLPDEPRPFSLPSR